jgi:uncharacterized protein YjbI with pentapeptide repeats
MQGRMVWALLVVFGGGKVVRPYLVARFRGQGSDLRRAWLLSAPLEKANLLQADLRGAVLSGANLRHADLRDAKLHGASLCGVNLEGADLGGAVMRDADLRGADFSRTQLAWPVFGTPFTRYANIIHARYDAQTCWPAGFDPARHGAIKE